MFTKRFFLVLFLCIVLALVAIAWTPAYYASIGIAILLGAATLVDALWTFIASRKLTVNRRHETYMSLGQPNEVILEVGAKSRFLKRNTHIMTFDTVPRTFSSKDNIEFRGFGIFKYFAIPSSRGRHEFGAIRCFVTSKFPGLFEWRRFFYPTKVVKVYPTFHNLDKIDLAASMHDRSHGQQRLRRPCNSTEFEQIRQYVAGDDVRSINWRATARANQLMVNTYIDEKSKPVIPIICAGPSMLVATDGVTLLDRATSAAVALASSAVSHYDEAGLVTLSYRGVETYLKPECSQRAVSRILESCYDFGLPPTESEQQYTDDLDVSYDDLDPKEMTSILYRLEVSEADANFDALSKFAHSRFQRRSLVVLFANFENLHSAYEALPVLQRISKKHLLLVVLFKNEGIENTATEPYKKGAKVSQKLSKQRFRALCAQQLEQQHLLVEQLRKNGIRVVNCHPDELSTSVVSAYLEIKDRGLL